MPVDHHEQQQAAQGQPREHQPAELADPGWFRPPSRREHLIAAGLFVGFALFFAILFVLNRGWWFRWVILALAVWSLGYGIRHAHDARRQRRCST